MAWDPKTYLDFEDERTRPAERQVVAALAPRGLAVGEDVADIADRGGGECDRGPRPIRMGEAPQVL